MTFLCVFACAFVGEGGVPLSILVERELFLCNVRFFLYVRELLFFCQFFVQLTGFSGCVRDFSHVFLVCLGFRFL